MSGFAEWLASAVSGEAHREDLQTSIWGSGRYGDGVPAFTLLEMELLELLAAIKRKPDWPAKVFDGAIVDKWRHETAEQLAPALFEYAIAELRWAAQSWQHGEGVRCSPVEGVYESDSRVCEALRGRLLEGVAALEASGEPDWHPGSDGQVRDLVHPSLFCYVAGLTRKLSSPSGAAFESMGAGETTPPPEQLAPTELPYRPTGRPSRRFESRVYQWLPSDVTVAASGEVRFDSYVNNLHPRQFPQLYRALESTIAAFIPLWERVLTAMVSARPRRVAPDMYALYGEDGGSDFDWDDSDADDKYDLWYMNRQVVNPPVLAPWSAPDPPARLVQLKGRPLQVIVKLANIELTPDKPTYPGGSWHVEGMMNEAIVASGIYYLASENISQSQLAFRVAVCEPPYEQNDNRGVLEVFGLEDEQPLNQQLGSVITEQGRCVAFPNCLQHQVQPFGLADPSLPGHRKILALFLVDPFRRVTSTADCPPQQREWLRQELRMMRPFWKLPLPVLDLVMSHLGDFPVDWPTACAHREQLMRERSAVVSSHNEVVFERAFSLCEH